MGYYTRLSGAITIDPPLTSDEVERLPDVVRTDKGRETTIVVVDVERKEEYRGDWTRVVYSANQITPVDSIYKAYDIEKDLQWIIDSIGAGHTYSGSIEGDGEEMGDLWRLSVRNGKTVMVKPKIIWPEDADG